ncbi:hypothetical protein C8Q73DRAFT_266238 [Cubamyces lactineus]|nr:hypothetical protein C8Q73DRAFT_266238 [Cubamyces lactineus]
MTGHSAHIRKPNETVRTKANEHATSTIRPFDRLPVEILAMILSWVAEEPYSSDPNRTDIRHCDPHFLPTYVSYPWQLKTILQVCSHWHSVALKTPDIWCRIDVYESVEPLVICLDRSRNKMMDVSLHRLSGARQALPLLVAHSHRLRKLSVHWPSEDIENEDECRALTDQVAQMDLPALQELLVDHGEILWPEGLPLDPNLLPSLQIVMFDTHYISWDSTIFTQLRVLHLRDLPVDHEEEISLSAFLEILAGCQLLEELVLARAVCIAFPYLTSEGPFAGPIVELPKLRLLHLEWDHVWKTPCESYQLLQHLRLRPQTAVRIAVDFAGRGYGSGGSGGSGARSLLELVPHDLTSLPILTTGTCVRVSLPGPSSLQFIRFMVESSLGGDDFILLLAKEPKFNWPEGFGIDQHLVDFCTLFADAPLTRLHLDADGLSTAGLESLFRLLQRLTIIEVDYHTPEAFKQYLNVLASSPSPALSTCRENGSSCVDNTRDVFVPQLRSLKLKKVRWHPELLSDVERCLEWRSERGTRLEELYVEAYGRERDTEGEVALELQHIMRLLALQTQVKGLVDFVDVPVPSK